MKSKKALLAITAIIITLLSGCASSPSHLIIAPEITTPPISQVVQKQASLKVTDMRIANHVVQILREGEAATLFSAQERLEDIIKYSLSKHWQQQGLFIQTSAVNSIDIEIEKALISITQEMMSYQAKSEIRLTVSINNSQQTLTSTFKNHGSSNGPFKADIAVLERNFNQRLTNLLQEILINKKINDFIK